MCLWVEETGSFHVCQPGTHGAGAKRVPSARRDAGSKDKGGQCPAGGERAESRFRKGICSLVKGVGLPGTQRT